MTFLAALLALVAAPPTLVPGSSAQVASTSVECTTGNIFVRCVQAAGVTAEISKYGKVRVFKGNRVRFPKSAGFDHLVLQPGDSFTVSATPLYCRVQGTDELSLRCEVRQAGKRRPGSYGFEISEKRVVVFRIDAKHARRVVRTIAT